MKVKRFIRVNAYLQIFPNYDEVRLLSIDILIRREPSLKLGADCDVMFLILIFGLILLAITSSAAGWVVLPILFILILYTVLAVIINIVFNRNSEYQNPNRTG